MKQNPIKEMMGYTKGKKEVPLSIALAMISVLAGVIPFFAMGRMAVLLVQRELNQDNMIIMVGLIFGGYLVKTVCYIGSTSFSHRMAYDVMADMRCILIDKLKRVSLGAVHEKTTGEYKHTIIDEIEHIENPLAHMLPEVTSNLLGFLLILICLFIIDWRMALASIITLLLGFVIYGGMVSGKDVKGMMEKYTTDSAMMTGAMVEYVEGMEVNKAFGQTASTMNKFSTTVNTFKDSMNIWFAHCHPYLAGFYVVTPCSLLFVLPIGTILLANGFIGLSTFLYCMFLSLGLAEPMIKLVEFTDNMIAISTTMGKVDEIMNLPELTEGTKQVTSINLIKAEHINFSYKDKEVLHDISFQMKAGEKIAFVGPSGSGKSTIAKLLVRFYDVNSGSIQIDDVDIREMTLSNLMDKMSFVTQNNFLYRESILENIRIGDPSANELQIMEAAKRAGCHEFIMKLKDGYDTQIGEARASLSGGEKQRIAIARAILKNAPVVVLDEATAHLDPENEDKIQKSIEELLKGKSLMMIAHRLSTVIHSDCIYVMEDGKIAAFGTHHDLLKSCEWYHNMWNLSENSSGEEGIL